MPKEENPVGLSPHEPASINHISKSFQDGFDQYIKFTRVIFEVGILDDDKISRRMRNACMNGSPFPFVYCMGEYFYVATGIFLYIVL